MASLYHRNKQSAFEYTINYKQKLKQEKKRLCYNFQNILKVINPSINYLHFPCDMFCHINEKYICSKHNVNIFLIDVIKIE